MKKVLALIGVFGSPLASVIASVAAPSVIGILLVISGINSGSISFADLLTLFGMMAFATMPATPTFPGVTGLVIL